MVVRTPPPIGGGYGSVNRALGGRLGPTPSYPFATAVARMGAQPVVRGGLNALWFAVVVVPVHPDPGPAVFHHARVYSCIFLTVESEPPCVYLRCRSLLWTPRCTGSYTLAHWIAVTSTRLLSQTSANTSNLLVPLDVGEDVWTATNSSLLGPFQGRYGFSRSAGFPSTSPHLSRQ
ncbi:hypothetical protein HD554DRAFT_2073642 [Boletus coccyginus]|nr:hypothetical protein HD554DRAFT_2073642 [Boletus coccyginus]